MREWIHRMQKKSFLKYCIKEYLRMKKPVPLSDLVKLSHFYEIYNPGVDYSDLIAKGVCIFMLSLLVGVCGMIIYNVL